MVPHTESGLVRKKRQAGKGSLGEEQYTVYRYGVRWRKSRCITGGEGGGGKRYTHTTPSHSTRLLTGPFAIRPSRLMSVPSSDPPHHTHTLRHARIHTHSHTSTERHKDTRTHALIKIISNMHIFIYTHTHAHLYTNVRLSPGMSRCADIVNALSLGAACLLPSTCEDTCLTWYAWQKLNDMIFFFFDWSFCGFTLKRDSFLTCFKEHSLSLPARSGGTSVNCGSPRQWDINYIVVYISESSFHV